jgi:hypothetical protein
MARERPVQRMRERTPARRFHVTHAHPHGAMMDVFSQIQKVPKSSLLIIIRQSARPHFDQGGRMRGSSNSPDQDNPFLLCHGQRWLEIGCCLSRCPSALCTRDHVKDPAAAPPPPRLFWYESCPAPEFGSTARQEGSQRFGHCMLLSAGFWEGRGVGESQSQTGDCGICSGR